MSASHLPKLPAGFLGVEAKTASPLRAILGGVASQGGKLIDRTMTSDSPVRVLLHRALPNFDRVVSEQSITGGKGGLHAGAVLAGMALSSLKGTRTALNDGIRKSLDAGRGLKEGAGGGGLLGGSVGGASGWNAEGDPEDRWKRVLTHAAVGAGLGAGAGAPAGLYGTAGVTGVRAGARNFGQRIKGWDELSSLGITPKHFENHERMSGAVKNLLRSTPTTRGSSWRTLKAELKETIDQGDKAKVTVLGPGGRAAGSTFTGALGPALRKAKVTELDAGPIVNPDVAGSVLSPKSWQKLKASAPDLQQFFGTVAGDTTLYLGNPKSDAKAKLLKSVVDRALAQSDGRPPEFIPRRSTDSLLRDLLERKSQAPIDIPHVNATHDGTAAFIQALPKSVIKRTGRTKEEIANVAARAKQEGNINIKRVWDSTHDTADEARRFSVDMNKDFGPQAARNPKINELVAKPDATWRDKILSEDKVFTREGIKDWKPSFNPKQQQMIADIQRRLRRGESLDAAGETEKALGMSRADLREMFAKPQPPKPAVAPPVAATPEPAPLRLLPDPPKTAPTTKPIATSPVAAPMTGFKKGDVWELVVDDLKRGVDPKKVLPPWDKVEDVLGMTKDDLLRDAGVRNAKDWEQFKRLMARAAKEDAPGALAKAASCHLPIRIRWAFLRLSKA